MIQKINNFLDELLEKSIFNETFLILSSELIDILSGINHPIAKKLLSESQSGKSYYKVTFLDIVDKVDGNGDNIYDIISFAQSNKVMEKIAKKFNIILSDDISTEDRNSLENELYYNKGAYFGILPKAETTIGRIINKIFPNEFKASGDADNDIESFVNKYKAIRNPKPKFELVEGDDILHWYNQEQYNDSDGGTLNGSCMRYGYCSEYLHFYSENKEKIRLLILKDPNDDSKIIGRSIIWKIDELDNEPVEGEVYFMDRIYYISDHIIDMFKTYAKEQDWLCKSKQNMNAGEEINDLNTGEVYNKLYVRDLNDPGFGHYPYMDTLKYFCIDDRDISNVNNIGDTITLEYTDGTQGGYWSEYYNECINTEDDDIIWCEKGDDYRKGYDYFYSEYYSCCVANDYAEDNGKYCDYYNGHGGDNWREKGDYVELSNGEYATSDYENMVYSEWSNNYILDDEAVWSEYHNSFIENDEAVEVYTNDAASKTDWRVDDKSDGNWWIWEHDDEKYDDDVTEEDLRSYHDLDEDEDEDEDEENND